MADANTLPKGLSALLDRGLVNLETVNALRVDVASYLTLTDRQILSTATGLLRRQA